MTEMQAAKDVVKMLQSASHQAVFAGGCVRDMLLDLPPHDIDIATSATPDEVEALFSRTVAVGKQFGVVIVKIADFDFEVATFRTDGEYTDGRRPDTVEFASMEEDAARRDFTINALFFDPTTETVHDFVGGKPDLLDGRLRFVGDAEKRIAEDHLRIMRAFRFAAKFDMDFSLDTAAALRKHAGLLRKVSVERVKMELDKMLLMDRPSRAFKLMQEFGILEVVLPEVAALDGEAHSARWHSEGDVFVHTMMVLDAASERTDDLGVLWAAILHDVGKPATAALNKRGDIANHGHEFVSERMAVDVMKRLKASTAETDKVAFLCREHMRVKKVHQMKRFKVRRLAASEWIWDLFDLAVADSESSHAIDPALDENKFAWKEVLLKLDAEVGLGIPRPVLTGDDLITMGFKPGPAFKTILDKVQEEQLEDRILTTEDAVAFVEKRFKGMKNG